VSRVPAPDLCERREARSRSHCLAASGERECAGPRGTDLETV
jgi:hypothetical protein